MESSSFYLFAVPTFWEGAAAVFDPTDSLSTYHESPSGAEADALAVYADWQAVAADFGAAVHEVSGVPKEASACAS